METLKQNILQILDQFKKEEIGNRVSQFSLLALISAISQEFDKAISDQKVKSESEKK